MTSLQALFLGLLQGLTEFLPVSSSGHLVLSQVFFGIQNGGAMFEIILHFGTLLAVLTELRKRVWKMIKGVLSWDPSSWRILLLLVVGTVPASVVGLVFKEFLEKTFTDPKGVSVCFLITGFMLWSTKFASGDLNRIGFWDAIFIGIAQSIGVFPGISRSGMTIGTGLWRGISGKDAAVFSFLLSIPIVLGATVFKFLELVENPLILESVVPLLVGTVIAYISGVIAIRWMFTLLRGGRLDRFSYYCWMVGILGLVFFKV